jgi:hypothetical protein
MGSGSISASRSASLQVQPLRHRLRRELLTLLPEAQVQEAEILGRAMRFGAMFTVAKPTDHGELTWRPKRQELVLTLKTDRGSRAVRRSDRGAVPGAGGRDGGRGEGGGGLSRRAGAVRSCRGGISETATRRSRSRRPVARLSVRARRGSAATMRLSRYFLPVLKETPAEAQIVSHRLMLRAGMIKQASAGIYSWLPLGFKVLAERIEQIVHEEQARAGHPCHADADDPVRRPLARERALRRLRGRDAADQGPARPRHAVHAHGGGADHRHLPRAM